MPNIPGIPGYYQPTVVSRVRTLQRALSIPGGLRILSIIGEGRQEELVVSSAVGDGTDGFDPTFTTTPTDGYGRFFKTANTRLQPNRTTLLLNGSTLRILEGTNDGSSFASSYDARLDPVTGQIEMQSASLVDQGGLLYSESSSNTGDGYLSTPTLTDTNAPAETWTIRCVSVLRDSFGAAIRGQATFTAKGSVSGQLADAYGQPYVWRSDGTTIDNGILSFAIFNISPSTAFEIGDRFTIEVASRVLQARDSLEARYIAQADLNDPVTYSEPSQVFAKYGTPSTENTLSLGAQMAFENGATSILALQAKPPMPRRTSEIVLPAFNSITGIGGASGNDDPDDLIFAIEAPGKPDTDTVVHFFLIGTDGTETQIFPNKVGFYDPDITAAFAIFENSGVSTTLESEFMDPAKSGTPYSYTVVSDDAIEQDGVDGYITPIGVGSTATFYSPSAQFTALDISLGKELDFITSTANEGRFELSSIVDANTVILTRGSGFFIAETNLKWQLILPTDTSQRVLFTSDLALAANQGLRITYIDQEDADFFDANWSETLEVLETQDVQILVPLPTQTFSAIQQAYRVHVEAMSSTYYKRERVLLTGAMNGLTVQQVLGNVMAAPEDIGVLEGIQGDDVEEVLDGNIEDLANYGVAFNFSDSFRVMYFYPDQIVRVINGTRETIPGYYMAAAAGGWFAGEPNIAKPLTFKNLVGFTILNDNVFKQTELNKLGDAGIAVVEPITGGGRVLHGKTTTGSGAPEEEEISIVFIRDHVARTMRRSFQTFIGQPEDPTLIPSLTARAIGLLNAFVSQNLITAYRNLSVSRDAVEPRQYNIVLEVQPNYPVNWIFVDISVGLF